MIIDLRGTHGSGKSWVVHQLLERYGRESLVDGEVTIGHLTFPPERSVAVVGTYGNACGGCDGIKSADEVCRRVGLLATRYRNVLLEGILVSHTFKRYSALAHELQHFGYTFCFLNTPLKTCIARVQSRRLARGNEKPFDPKNVIGDWHNIWETVRPKMVAAGHRVEILDYKNPLPRILELLEP